MIQKIKSLFSKIINRNKHDSTINNDDVIIIVETLDDKIKNFKKNDDNSNIDLELKEIAQEMYLLPKYKEEGIKLWNISDQISKPLLVVIMGEFKTGKSTFINAILGEEILKSDVTPATAVVSMISYGESKKIKAHLFDGSSMDFEFEELKNITAEGDDSKSELRSKIRYVEIFIKKEILKKITIVDTPGLNVDNKLHIEATKSFMNEADYVYWVFSYGKAASKTEVASIKELSSFIKPTAIVNRIDEIDEEEETIDDVLDEIRYRLKDCVSDVIGVSSYLAKKGILENDKDLLKESNWCEFEDNLNNTVINNSVSLKSRVVKIKINDYINQLNILVNKNTENLDKITYKINDSNNYKNLLLEDIHKFELYVRAANDMKVNSKNHIINSSNVIKLYENNDMSYVEYLAKFDKKIDLLNEFYTLLSRIENTERILEVIESYNQEFEDIDRNLTLNKDNINRIIEQSDALKLEEEDYNSQLEKYNRSGIFGGVPLFDWNGDSKRLQNWYDDLTQRRKKITDSYEEKIEKHKNIIRKKCNLNNEILEYISKTILTVFINKYKELLKEVKNFDKEIETEKANFETFKSELDTIKVLTDKLQNIINKL